MPCQHRASESRLTSTESPSSSLPRDLAAVADELRGPDVTAASRRLADRMVPGRLLDTDVVLGLCWATVDLERTAHETPLSLVEAEPDRLLGGVALSLRIGAFVLMAEEPSTEGRLAAFLARHGEGLCAVYVQRGKAPGAPMPRTSPTPIGIPGSVLAQDRPWGPFIIVIEPAG